MIPHPNGRDGELQHASIQAHWNAGEDRTFSAQEKEETVFTLGGASLCPGLVWFWPFRPQDTRCPARLPSIISLASGKTMGGAVHWMGVVE